MNKYVVVLLIYIGTGIFAGTVMDAESGKMLVCFGLAFFLGFIISGGIAEHQESQEIKDLKIELGEMQRENAHLREGYTPTR